MAWNIVRHAFVIVFGNWREALRASVIPFVISIALIAVMLTVTGVPLQTNIGLNLEEIANPGAIFVVVLASLALMMFTFSWVAVTWHRFILLEEYPANVPVVADRPIGAYLRRTLMIVLQMMAFVVPLSFVIMPILIGLLENPVMLATVSIAFNVLLSYVWLRVSVSLPSVAVGQPMGSIDAWAKTSHISQTILGTALIMIVLNFVASMVFSLALGPIPIISTIASLAVQWISMMVGISVLTTIYGHVIEGRPLVD